MADFLKTVEMILIDMWNYLHVVLQFILNDKDQGENNAPVDPIV